MLSADDLLPFAPRRVAVAGVSGVGKTTYADQVARRLGVPQIEIDSLFHGSGWTPRPTFLDDVRALVAREAWVTEWQYDAARPLLAERADLLIWLDLPVSLTLARLVRRTLRRRFRGEVLWNGNVEPPLWTVLTRRENILRWAWRTRHKYRDLVPDLASAHPHLMVVHLRTRADAALWLARLGSVGSMSEQPGEQSEGQVSEGGGLQGEPEPISDDQSVAGAPTDESGGVDEGPTGPNSRAGSDRN